MSQDRNFELEVIERLTRIETQIASCLEIQKDHSARVGRLEVFKTRALAMAAALGFIGGNLSHAVNPLIALLPAVVPH